MMDANSKEFQDILDGINTEQDVERELGEIHERIKKNGMSGDYGQMINKIIKKYGEIMK